MPADLPPEPGASDAQMDGALGRLSEPLVPGEVTTARTGVAERGRRAIRRRRAIAGAGAVAAAAVLVVGVAVAAPDHDSGSRVRTGDGSTTVSTDITTSTTAGGVATSTTQATATTQPTTTITESTTTTSAPATGAGCTQGSADPPVGAASKPIPDVDGDGKPDELWLAWGAKSPQVVVGIRTAAGGGAEAEFGSASPVTRQALVVDADERGPSEILLDDGREVQLYAFSGCQIQPVLNPQGQTYTFGLGGITGIGTGIGCIQTAAGRRLAGLNVDSRDGDHVAWSSTVVDLQGLSARNGDKRTGVYQSPADDQKIQLLEQVTCGDLTMEHDGVTLGP